MVLFSLPNSNTDLTLLSYHYWVKIYMVLFFPKNQNNDFGYLILAWTFSLGKYLSNHLLHSSIGICWSLVFSLLFRHGILCLCSYRDDLYLYCVICVSLLKSPLTCLICSTLFHGCCPPRTMSESEPWTHSSSVLNSCWNTWNQPKV